MKHYQYFGLLAAIWLAPYCPDTFNILFGFVFIAISFYYCRKDQ